MKVETSVAMEPVLFAPIIQSRRWGGDRLATKLGKQLPAANDVYGESWEIVDRHDQQSKIAFGPTAGQTIRELIQANAEQIYGGAASADKQFPFLIKFLDCQQDLSVQVHPNDEQAKVYHPSETGKTECWFVLDAEPGSVVYVGFQPGTTADQIRAAVSENRLAELLKAYPAKKGDGFYIPAGTVHAIGQGLVIAEIQQPSDLTFRLYDWGCVDQNGQPRQLHVDDALAVMTLDESFDPRAARQEDRDAASEPLQTIVSPYFQVDIYEFSEGTLQISHEECLVLMVLEGAGVMQSGEFSREVELGQTWLLPACNGSFVLEAGSGVKVAVVREP
jgi:mannose-6-phosphate isomerase